MKTKSNNSDYVLKAKYEGLQIGLTGVTVNNKNITNELALQLLQVHDAKKIFDKFPEAGEIDLDKTNHTIAVAAGFKVKSASKEQLKNFAAEQGIELSSEELDKPNLLKEVTAWLDKPLMTVVSDAPSDADTTNMQFATADNFDLATVSNEDKIAFIEKYQIDYEEKTDGEAFTTEEVNEIISTWLAKDTLG
jgi:hypothetical protein